MKSKRKMQKKILMLSLSLVIFLLSVSMVSATLGDYPAPFVSNGTADVTIIYGADAESIYVDAASIFSSDLATHLATQAGTKLGSVAMSDTQAESLMPTTNLIIIGGPNVNRVAAKLIGAEYPANASVLGYGENEALLELYQSPYDNAKTALLVAGWTGRDTKSVIDKIIYTYNREALEGESRKVFITCKPEWECIIGVCQPSGVKIKTCKEILTKCGMNQTQEEIPCTSEECSGCLYSKSCIPFGNRLKINDTSSYCDISRNIESQKETGEECQNNYECRSNMCTGEECIGLSFIQQIFNWFKAIFGLS